MDWLFTAMARHKSRQPGDRDALAKAKALIEESPPSWWQLRVELNALLEEAEQELALAPPLEIETAFCRFIHACRTYFRFFRARSRWYFRQFFWVSVRPIGFRSSTSRFEPLIVKGLPAESRCLAVPRSCRRRTLATRP